MKQIAFKFKLPVGVALGAFRHLGNGEFMAQTTDQDEPFECLKGMLVTESVLPADSPLLANWETEFKAEVDIVDSPNPTDHFVRKLRILRLFMDGKEVNEVELKSLLSAESDLPTLSV